MYDICQHEIKSRKTPSPGNNGLKTRLNSIIECSYEQLTF